MTTTIVTEIPFEAIELGERARQDYGDLNELKNSILRRGLIHPLVVNKQSDGRYLLLAGGRRYAAIKELEWTSVAIRFYNDLSPLERLEIELEENLHRKNLEWPEEVALKAKIDTIKRQIHGSKQQGASNQYVDNNIGKFGILDLAKELHESPGNVSRDLQLARAIHVLPEIAKEDSKVMAFRKLKRLERLIERELLARQTMKLPSDELPFVIINADARAGIATLKDESVQCVVTSPPYWAQRDYGVVGQLGLEPTPALYVKNLADVFDDLLHRVLKKDGTLWVNIDDTYADENKGGAPTGFVYDTAYGASVSMSAQRLLLPSGTKKKDLVGIPWMFAFEMRQRGWWLRSAVIWYKSSSTPEGTTDRPVNVHEYVFMFAKSDVYKFNNQDWLNADPMKRKIRSVWPIDLAPTGDSGHIAAFPEELPGACIQASTDEGDVVLDPFVGSGSTGIAALHHDREFVGIDLHKDYADGAEQRLRATYADTLAGEVEGEDAVAETETVAI